MDAVDYVTYVKLANLNTALRRGLLDLIEVQLKCVGGDRPWTFRTRQSFQPAIDEALRRRLQ